MAKGNKSPMPVANHKPPIGKHVPSAVQGATVRDNSAAMACHVEQSPQTVGGNPNPPAVRQSSGQAAGTPVSTASQALWPDATGIS